MRLTTVTLNGTLDRVLQIPGFVPGEIHYSRDVVTYGGGKGLNVARAAKALGIEVAVTGLVAGQCGEWICALLYAEGIREHLIHLPGGQSRTSTIVLDPQCGHTTVVHDQSPQVPPGEWPEIRSRINHAVSSSPWLALGGSVPRGLPDSVYADLCHDACARGQRVCLDTRGDWLVQGLAARPFLAKCNQHEAAEVARCPVCVPEQARDVAQAWAALGIPRVVITMGAHGAVAVTGEEAWHVQAPVVDVVCPIGSGDATMAGLIVALDQGGSWPEAVRYGAAVGAANALVPGSGYLDTQALPELLSRTPIQAM